MCVCVHSQAFLLGDVKRGSHVDKGGQTVQVVTVGVREDGVGLAIERECKRENVREREANT